MTNITNLLTNNKVSNIKKLILYNTKAYFNVDKYQVNLIFVTYSLPIKKLIHKLQ